MTPPTAEVNLELIPQSRLDLIDVNQRVAQDFGQLLSAYRRVLYYSYHTTAGYFEQSLCRRLENSREGLQRWIGSFQRMFPPQADYRHDQLQLRSELSDEQRRTEPLNGDSHLTFIGSGLTNCVTYQNQEDQPVYFVDLDGIFGDTQRRRHTTVVGFNQERVACEFQTAVPVSHHPIDSVNLKDLRLGFFEELQEMLRAYGIVHGRVDVSLEPAESHAGLTVNEYETLLMKHDLIEVLRNPFRFMAEKGKSMLGNPRAIPGKAINYAKYDLVHVVNDFLDALGLSESFVERVIDKFLAFPASRFLWMKREASLLVSDPNGEGIGRIVEGTYQSPILVQWKRSRTRTRRLKVRLVRFD